MQDDMPGKTDADERRIGELIQRAGPRLQPDAATREAVRRVVNAEWQSVVAARAAARNRFMGWAAAATFAVVGFAVWLVTPTLRDTQAAVATVVRVSGEVDTADDDTPQDWQHVAAGGTLRARSELRTGTRGRAALGFGRDVSVRVDQNSLVGVVAADRIALKQGAVYVDAGNRPDQAEPLVIETAYGVVRHLGTQYEARLTDDSVRLRVREGRVMITSDSRTHEAVAGEQLAISEAGAARREQIPRSGEAWSWVSDIAPAYDIENRPLSEFLQWAVRETGREVVYTTPQVQNEARSVILRGSIEGFTPERALVAVLSTTELSYRETPEQVVVDFRPGDRRE
jgi:ferric-dicitrate binding protein FerR (iron transport regulator)